MVVFEETVVVVEEFEESLDEVEDVVVLSSSVAVVLLSPCEKELDEVEFTSSTGRIALNPVRFPPKSKLRVVRFRFAEPVFLTVTPSELFCKLTPVIATLEWSWI